MKKDTLLIDNKVHSLPFGYTLKTELKEIGQTVKMADGSSRKDWRDARFSWTLDWATANEEIKKAVMDIYRKTAQAKEVIFIDREGNRQDVSIAFSGWSLIYSGVQKWYKNVSLKLS